MWKYRFSYEKTKSTTDGFILSYIISFARLSLNKENN